MLKQLTPRQLMLWLETPEKEKPKLIDVRLSEEFYKGHIEGSMNIMFDDLLDHVASFSHNAPYVIICVGFDKATQAGLLLKQYGIHDVYILLGGIFSWEKRGGALVTSD